VSDGPESALHSGVNTIRYQMVPKTENFKAKLRLPSLHLPFLDGLGRLLHLLQRRRLLPWPVLGGARLKVQGADAVRARLEQVGEGSPLRLERAARLF